MTTDTDKAVRELAERPCERLHGEERGATTIAVEAAIREGAALLAKGLVRYADHRNGCLLRAIPPGRPDACTCGYTAALRDFEAATMVKP